MTPKQKAKELVDKFSDVENLGRFSDNGLSSWSSSVLEKQSKECALIAVNEIILSLYYITDKYIELGVRLFWHEVKTEIENL